VSRLDDALALVAIDSVSHGEATIAHHVAVVLGRNPDLDVERIGDNVVARTTGHHATRLLVAGHLDTVPGDASAAVIDGDELRGVGACDMKGSLSVMLELASTPTPRSVEVTWVFYAREEISRKESGLLEIAELRPELLDADAAILAEPTDGRVEAGCQGTLRVSIEMTGARAHTARPFTGRNAIHRLGDVITKVASYEPRTAVIDGIEFTEQLQVVDISGGVAHNVVPDQAQCTLNHRVAPDRTKDQAFAWLVAFLGPRGTRHRDPGRLGAVGAAVNDQRTPRRVGGAHRRITQGEGGMDRRRDVRRTQDSVDEFRCRRSVTRAPK
jgi:succinyl-diaminopimelate desuccinylase